ncbi:DUF881 domain-containing protein [Cumulibacter soli]|uniref:DUF881 domain-containing protein n=1 Tax=Cumulibacter soli TaxID=2546344 RepID=UPI0010682554|nr:DUF881 domain-containing protein [Cumulibacter soli]
MNETEPQTPAEPEPPTQPESAADTDNDVAVEKSDEADGRRAEESDVADGDAAGQPDEDRADEADGDPEDEQGEAPVRRRTNWTRGRLAIAFVCLLLGLGVAVQVQLTSDTERDLRGARQEDLVRILDDLDNQHARLGTEVNDLGDAADDLASGGGAAEAAQQEAQQRLDQLAILNGTVAASGPGISLEISDMPPDPPVEMMITVIQELRAAGAEAIQVGSIRVAMTSAVTTSDGAILIDGQPLQFPMAILAIGDPATLATAMGIPGGAVASVSYVGATATVEQLDNVKITALRDLDAPDYAEPAKPSK